MLRACRNFEQSSPSLRLGSDRAWRAVQACGAGVCMWAGSKGWSRPQPPSEPHPADAAAGSRAAPLNPSAAPWTTSEEARVQDAAAASAAQHGQSNVVPWRRHVRPPPPDRLPPADDRIIILFDLNGTLTSHTSKRRSAGINRMRPGLEHLQRLQGLFRLGIFSSSSDRTVGTVIPLLHNAIQRPAFTDRGLILTRTKTEQAPHHHIAAGGNAWDTVKPLRKQFGDRIHRIVLVDDDAYKACPGEERNMLLVPRWEESDEDDVIVRLVDALLLALGPLADNTDVRDYIPDLSRALTGQTAAAALESGQAAEAAEAQLAPA